MLLCFVDKLVGALDGDVESRVVFPLLRDVQSKDVAFASGCVDQILYIALDAANELLHLVRYLLQQTLRDVQLLDMEHLEQHTR